MSEKSEGWMLSTRIDSTIEQIHVGDDMAAKLKGIDVPFPCVITVKVERIHKQV